MATFKDKLTAVRELGLRKLSLLALYRFGLSSGHLKRVTSYPMPFSPDIKLLTTDLFYPPQPDFYTHHDISHSDALAEADDLCRGVVRLFGNDPTLLNLIPEGALAHWSDYELNHASWGDEDIKLIWEPARFSWAFKLARAYATSHNEAYPNAFWFAFESFQLANPPYLGPNWISAQEAALRIMAFVFCDQVFSNSESSTPERRQALLRAISDHAQRIPPTLIYARAQNNNHLISEAVGLYTAGLYLANHPLAEKWKKLGWKWFNWAIQNQVSPQGTYIQHSSNYHRLMLQLALWMQHLQAHFSTNDTFPEQNLSKLAAATEWLASLVDASSGGVPNLGANDGALILPLTSRPIDDYRPTVQAAGAAFLNQAIFLNGSWDELGVWFDLPMVESAKPIKPATDMIRIDAGDSHAFLRAAHFSDRPSHADQLHLDLWHKGRNIAVDAGTFSYNAEAPWQNALASTLVHNTVSLDGLDQMKRVTRFLWLNWAQAQVTKQYFDPQGQLLSVSALHNGYEHLGWHHQRTLSAQAGSKWVIDDLLVPTMKNPEPICARLAWLFLESDWEFDQELLILHLDTLKIQIRIKGADSLALVRAGKTLFGELQPKPTWGWYSPTYNKKVPALQLIAFSESLNQPFFSTHIQFID